jgi:hypothetical protein
MFPREGRDRRGDKDGTERCKTKYETRARLQIAPVRNDSDDEKRNSEDSGPECDWIGHDASPGKVSLLSWQTRFLNPLV